MSSLYRRTVVSSSEPRGSGWTLLCVLPPGGGSGQRWRSTEDTSRLSIYLWQAASWLRATSPKQNLSGEHCHLPSTGKALALNAPDSVPFTSVVFKAVKHRDIAQARFLHITCNLSPARRVAGYSSTSVMSGSGAPHWLGESTRAVFIKEYRICVARWINGVRSGSTFFNTWRFIPLVSTARNTSGRG